MSNSAFNMSKCGSSGGKGGASCNASGWTEIVANDGNDITVVSTDIIRQELRRIYMDDKQNHTTQVADIVHLKYDCPRVGDAVFWNAYKNGYDLASAEVDNGNYAKDSEHLIESLGIVESVLIDCETGKDMPDDGYTAKVVFFGKITFANETTELEPGIVYYLSDTLARINASTQLGSMIGSNAVHGRLEPVISKPLFVATGKHTAIVTNYRPLTGSPTGGRPLSEEYRMQITPHMYEDTDGNFLYSGWKILVENTGTVSSRNHLLLQIEYNKLEGPQPADQNQPLISDEIYAHHVDLGVLYNSAEASVSEDDSFVSSKTIDFNPGNVSYVTGIGEVNVKLKVLTQSTSNVTFTDKLNAPEVLVINAGEIKKSRIVPTLEWKGKCFNNQDNNNDIYVKGDTVVQAPDTEEGTVFEVTLTESELNSVGSGLPPQQKKVPMPYNIGFKIDSMTASPMGGFDVSKTWSPITGTFKLSLPDREMLEIIPVSSDGQTVVENRLRIVAVNRDGTSLPPTHWAYEYSENVLENNTQFCYAGTCCLDSQGQLIPDSQGDQSVAKSITEILDNDSNLLNNKDGATFYSKTINASSFTTNNGTLALSWKNCRENTIFCYDSSINAGDSPSFMTIYTNEARQIPESWTSGNKTENESQFYDPRYTLMEIGAQNTLNGTTVRITVNSGNSTESNPETCFTFTFDGDSRGKHFTLEELEKLQPLVFNRRTL